MDLSLSGYCCSSFSFLLPFVTQVSQSHSHSSGWNLRKHGIVTWLVFCSHKHLVHDICMRSFGFQYFLNERKTIIRHHNTLVWQNLAFQRMCSCPILTRKWFLFHLYGNSFIINSDFFYLVYNISSSWTISNVPLL